MFRCSLPHFPVIREDSPTAKVRIVFGGSVKTALGTTEMQKKYRNEMSSNLLTNISYDLLLASQKDCSSPEKDEPKTAEENNLINGQYIGHREDAQGLLKNNDLATKNMEIVWKNVAIFVVLHSVTVYGLYLLFTFQLKIATVLFAYFYTMYAAFGITAGAHRLWAHRSYTAKLPLRIFLMLAQSAALQNDIHEWARDHRVHHKFTDSDADPHNAKRGFFFSHVGWLMCKKHPDVFTKGKTVDMSDVLNDPVVRFQRKYYLPLILLMNLTVPTYVTYCWIGEDFWTSVIVTFGRYVLSLNGTWLVNSAAHIWGMKPYDQNIKPTENKFVAAVAFGEGWHNYHHVFPWDYKAAELGNYKWNFTTCFLDFMAKIGWATDLKTTSEEIIRKRMLRTGDNSLRLTLQNQESKPLSERDIRAHSEHQHPDDGDLIWGWGDKDMDQEEINAVRRSNRKKA
ncbi:hypothetical protein HUJ04_010977 [Dendroctonus ponderosae]|nr:hypothetical protein HUJ04_010977 [Dendroctonus ponderosae]